MKRWTGIVGSGAKLDDPLTQVNVGLITGLVLGSPEFQKR
jgi:hypothetical protein